MGRAVPAVGVRTRHADELHDLGADAVVADVDRAEASFDLVTESIGGTSLAKAVAKSRPGSTLVVFGASSGEPTPLSLYDFISGIRPARRGP